MKDVRLERAPFSFSNPIIYSTCLFNGNRLLDRTGSEKPPIRSDPLLISGVEISLETRLHTESVPEGFISIYGFM